MLLGSNAMWERTASRCSPGSSSRASRSRPPSIREVFEESGLRVVDPVYLGSQPWPFPASLMVGFRAHVPAERVRPVGTPDGEEILELRWFTRDELRDAATVAARSSCPGRPRSPARSSRTGTATRSTTEQAGDDDAAHDPPTLAHELLAGLDPEQRTAAETLLGPVCILAGAGTGKTRALTHRIAHGVATGVYDPARVLALTFTTRAAGELRTRLRQLGAGGVTARTFHSAALAQLSHFWPQVVGGSLPRILDARAGCSARRPSSCASGSTRPPCATSPPRSSGARSRA